MFDGSIRPSGLLERLVMIFSITPRLLPRALLEDY